MRQYYISMPGLLVARLLALKWWALGELSYHHLLQLKSSPD